MKLRVGPSTTWAIAVFASRDRLETLAQCLRHLVLAIHQPCTLDVLVNGNPELAREILSLQLEHSAKPETNIRVWSMTRADKASAFNAYLHDIWPHASWSFLIDGYVCVAPDALQKLENALSKSPAGLAACGMPTVGFSAASIRREMSDAGGLHGNLFAMRREAMDGLLHQRFRLPSGLYRVDSTIGAAVAFGLDPTRHDWNPKSRIVNDPSVVWGRAPESITPLGMLRRTLGRRRKQAQGDFENRAVSHFFARLHQPIGALPASVAELVSSWARQDPKGHVELMQRGARWRTAWAELCRSPVAEGDLHFDLLGQLP